MGVHVMKEQRKGCISDAGEKTAIGFEVKRNLGTEGRSGWVGWYSRVLAGQVELGRYTATYTKLLHAYAPLRFPCAHECVTCAACVLYDSVLTENKPEG